MKYKLQVTQEHIDRAIPTNRRCPIALALCDVMIPGVRPKVEHGSISYTLVSTGGTQCTVDVDEDVTLFMTTFDEGDDVSPLELEIEIPGFYLQKEEEVI